MNVAYINADPGIPVFGTKGASIHVQEVLRALLKRGASIDLFATRLGGDVPEEFRSLHIHTAVVAKSSEVAAREESAMAAASALRDQLLIAARTRHFDLVYERYSLWSCAALELARDRGIRSVLEVNAPLVEEQARHRSLAHRFEAEENAGRAFAAASVITVVSRQLGDIIGRHPAARGKIHVVPNAVNPERFATLVPARPAEPGAFTVGFVGTLKPWHGLDTLAEAFIALAPRVPNARLLVVGDGPEREELERRFAETGWITITNYDHEGRSVIATRDRNRNRSSAEEGEGDASSSVPCVHFTGAVAPEAVPGFLASMDVAVAPYPPLEDFYFSPLKVFEYMAAGLPVVGSRIGQVEEIIRDDVTGVLVPPGDAAALAAALRELAAAPDKRRALGAAARRDVLAGHTWDQVVARVLGWTGLGAAVDTGR